MIRFLYTFGIIFYEKTIHLFSFFNPKARLWIEGRKDIFKALESKVEKNKKYTWFHCASLGEFEQAKPLIEKIKQHHSEKIIVTFFSPSGYEIRKNYKHADIICYLPSDTLKNATKFFSIVPIKKAFFIKYEFWYNYIYILNKKNVPLYLVSGVFRENQVFFKWWGKWFKKHLSMFHYFFVQNIETANTLKNHQIYNSLVTGDTRFDRVIETSKEVIELETIKKFKGEELLIVLGSSWEKEETLLFNYLQQKKESEHYKIIIAPHDISQKHIDFILELFKNYNTTLLSKYNPIKESDIMIINSIGLLSKIYKYADIGIIGGAFGNGLHNILEPSVFGVPMIFGPKIKRFQEAIDITNLKAAYSIKNQSEFNNKLELLIKNKIARKEKAHLLKQYVLENKGATEKILAIIKTQ